MKYTGNVILIFLLVLLGIGSTVLAQGGNDSQLGQLRRELDRTDELLMQAREAVRASDDALAAQALQRADQLQKAAREAYRNQAYLLALELTKKAREQAGIAVSNSRMAGQMDGVVNSRLERAREILDRVRESLPTPLSPSFTLAFDQARNTLAQAWEFYRQGQTRAAAKLVEQVEQAAQRLQNMIRLHIQTSNEFDHRLENVLRIMEQAQEQVADCDSESAREQIDQAQKGMQMARGLYAKGQPRAALLALNRAQETLRRAIRECQGGDRLQTQYRALVQEMEQLTERLANYEGPGLETALSLLKQAREQLALAYRHLGENKNDAAMVAMQAARLTLRQAVRYMISTN